MRIKCNNCGGSYDLPDAKREHYEQAHVIAEQLWQAHKSHATRIFIAALLLRRVAAAVGLHPMMVGAMADAYSAIVSRAYSEELRHPTLRIVN